jgi:hypothetical protein
VGIAPGFRSPLSKRGFTDDELVECARECVLAPSNNERFWEAEENRAADFCRAAAWMLAQDVYSFSPRNFEDVEVLLLKQV